LTLDGVTVTSQTFSHLESGRSEQYQSYMLWADLAESSADYGQDELIAGAA